MRRAAIAIVLVPRQNLIRLAQEHRDPSIRPTGPRPRAWLEVGRPASLDRRPCTVTRKSRGRTGSGRAGRLSWTCDACSMVVRTAGAGLRRLADVAVIDRKSTRLNSSHLVISYAVFCLKKKKE